MTDEFSDEEWNRIATVIRIPPRLQYFTMSITDGDSVKYIDMQDLEKGEHRRVLFKGKPFTIVRAPGDEADDPDWPEAGR